MADPRRKDAIFTVSGRVIRPLDPNPADICIEDIAHSLSNQCRFTGHTREFYSVAQHSVLVSKMCKPENALWGLLHDASEAYLSDIAKPVKSSDSMWYYREIESWLLLAVSKAFGLKWPIPRDVHFADDALLGLEVLALMPEDFIIKGKLPVEIDKTNLKSWAPDVAKVKFLERYAELTA